MSRNSDKQVISYAEALAAFKRDTRENDIIASLVREHLSDALVAPVLDVGAGSGELAALAFPDRIAFLLDIDDYGPSANPLHHRIQGDFLDVDLSASHLGTIIFCHSLNFLTRDMEQLSHRLRQSGARTAIVVSNENTGTLNEIAHRLAAEGMACNPTFHVPMPTAKLQMRIPFSIPIKCADFRTLSQHFVRILLDCALTDAMLAAVERELHRVTIAPHVEIAEAIYCYGCGTDAPTVWPDARQVP
jgi:hypothetical protein